MPKMTHPNVERPLSVLPEDVEARKAAGWVEVKPRTAQSTAPATEPKTATKKAVTRKTAKKS